MSLSELLKNCLFIQYCLHFYGVGKLPICIYTEASVAKQFAHRKGCGRMKHIDVCYMWLQETMEQAQFILRKILRSENLADLLTYPPSKADVDLHRERLSLHLELCWVSRWCAWWRRRRPYC